VPEHWEVGPLSKLTTTKTGFAFNSEDFTDEGIAVLRIGDIKSDGSVDFSEAKYLPIEVIQQRSDVIVESGDIVMAMTGATIGKASTYGYEAPALLNQRVCRFRARNSESQRFVYYSLLSRYYTEKVVITACGGAQPNISDQQLRLFRVAIPPLPEQLEIGDYICREVARIDSLSKEAENGIALLQERRRALISAAVTGKIDVRNYASTQKDAA
jgi:type I restriction enzyme S subunit